MIEKNILVVSSPNLFALADEDVSDDEKETEEDELMDDEEGTEEDELMDDEEGTEEDAEKEV